MRSPRATLARAAPARLAWNTLRSSCRSALGKDRDGEDFHRPLDVCGGGEARCDADVPVARVAPQRERRARGGQLHARVRGALHDLGRETVLRVDADEVAAAGARPRGQARSAQLALEDALHGLELRPEDRSVLLHQRPARRRLFFRESARGGAACRSCHVRARWSCWRGGRASTRRSRGWRRTPTRSRRRA